MTVEYFGVMTRGNLADWSNVGCKCLPWLEIASDLTPHNWGMEFVARGRSLILVGPVQRIVVQLMTDIVHFEWHIQLG